MDISIHALLAESDQQKVDRLYQAIEFLSTLSLRRATGLCNPPGAAIRQISIHALLAESDDKRKHRNAQYKAFLSTLSLRRATGTRPVFLFCDPAFLSTLSLRRATSLTSCRYPYITISIHALLAESDRCRCAASPR